MMRTYEEEIHLAILKNPTPVPIPPYTFEEWGKGIKQLLELGYLAWNDPTDDTVPQANEEKR